MIASGSSEGRVHRKYATFAEMNLMLPELRLLQNFHVLCARTTTFSAH
jgi:hypothetical protein